MVGRVSVCDTTISTHGKVWSHTFVNDIISASSGSCTLVVLLVVVPHA